MHGLRGRNPNLILTSVADSVNSRFRLDKLLYSNVYVYILRSSRSYDDQEASRCTGFQYRSADVWKQGPYRVTGTVHSVLAHKVYSTADDKKAKVKQESSRKPNLPPKSYRT